MTDTPRGKPVASRVDCPPHELTVILRWHDDRGRVRDVGRICPGCGLLSSMSGGGFLEGSKAHQRALEAARNLAGETLAAMDPPARRTLERLRRRLRGRR